MRGIADYNRELLAKNYRYYKPGVEDAPWDAKVMEVGDPFGNKLRFSEPNKADDPRPGRARRSGQGEARNPTIMQRLGYG